LGAICQVRLSKAIFAIAKYHAAKAGFDDAFIYCEIHTEPEARKIPFERLNI